MRAYRYEFWFQGHRTDQCNSAGDNACANKDHVAWKILPPIVNNSDELIYNL